MSDACEIAKLERSGIHKPYFIIERYATSDGVKTRVCEGFWDSYREAKQHCDWKNRP